MAIDFSAIHIATLALAFVAGLAITALSSTGIGRILILAALTGLVLMAVIDGPSGFVGNLAANMADHFFYQPFGLVGAALGILIGIGAKKKI